MRFLAISDTHNLHNQLKIDSFGVDCIIHAGDVSVKGTYKEVKDFLQWYSKLPISHKIFCAGNHDWFFENNKFQVAALLAEFPDVIYLDDSMVTIGGINIWGSPVQPTYHNWAFNRDRGEAIKKHWDIMPDNIDIMVQHGPPAGYKDHVLHTGFNVGCEDLRKAIWSKPSIKVDIFGHIHCDYGTILDGDKLFINAALVNDSMFMDYRIANKPVEFIFSK